ncbi:MAG: hypothetical protein AVDCRST_MAG85-2065, partial [uncultured Solirubrobacteraceae bacterium]
WRSACDIPSQRCSGCSRPQAWS